MKIKRYLFLVATLIVIQSTPILADQPLDGLEKMESLASAMHGSGAGTRLRILESFRSDMDGSRVRFTGALWTLSPISLDTYQVDEPNIRPTLFSWEFFGLRLKDEGSDGRTSNERAKHQLGGASEATLIILRSGKFQMYALTASPQIIDHLKQGTTVTLEAQVTGLLENSLFGFVTTVLAPDATPKCPNGHQLPDENDFKFCPYCGAPLNK